MSKKRTTAEFKKIINETYAGKIEILSDYVNNKTKLLVKCNECGSEEYKTPTKILKGQICNNCSRNKLSKERAKTTEDYEQDLRNKKIDYIQLLSEYKNSKTKLKVLNKKCNHIYYVLPGNILKGSGCPICHGIKDDKLFKKQIETKYPGEYKILGNYTNGLTKIKVRHKCGFEWDVQPKQLLRNIMCPRCHLSKGEYYIYKYLENKNIEYQRQYKISECKDKNELPFDFMIKINGTIKLIEFDGTQHYENTLYSQSNTKKHDKIKNEFCKNNNIELLRIPYWHLRNNKIKDDLDKFIDKESSTTIPRGSTLK